MHQVVLMSDTARSFYRSASERDCWNYIKGRLLHPSKAVRRQGAKLFVQRNTGALAPRMPYDVRLLLNL